MKVYFLYIVTAILNFYLTMILWGVSAGFASYLPIISLFSSILLFVLATPVIVFNDKLGLILGLIFSAAMIPFSVGHIAATIGDKSYNSLFALLFELPFLLPFVIAGFTGNRILKRNFYLHFPETKVLKLLLAITPVLLFILYAVNVSKYIYFSK